MVREPGSGRAAGLLAKQKREGGYDIDEWVELVKELEDDCLRLHREKMDALYGPDGFPRFDGIIAIIKGHAKDYPNLSASEFSKNVVASIQAYLKRASNP